MSKTLNLADRVLSMGRNLQELGRDSDALRLLGRLAGWRALPAALAEATHSCLAEIYLRHDCSAQARPHLSALVEQSPNSARYHYDLATALAADEEADAQAAVEHYRRSLTLHPDQVDCLCDFGLLMLRLGNHKEALQALRRAVQLAPDDAEVVSQLALALGQTGQHDHARRLVQAALFRNPSSTAFHKLWSTVRFHEARQAQQAARQRKALSASVEGPALLPFRRPTESATLKGERRRPMYRAGRTPLGLRRSLRWARISGPMHA